MRIAIAGVPQSGKTTLALELAKGKAPVFHADDYIELGWSGASEAVSHLFDESGPWVIEGVAVVRALRKWLKRNPEGKPCDRVIWLDEPREPLLLKGQRSMAKGCRTVWLEIVVELEDRGVSIESH